MKKMLWMFVLLFMLFGCIEKPQNEFVVSFMNTHHQVIEQKTYPRGALFGVIEETDTLKGHTFVGWQTVSGRRINENDVIIEDLVLYAAFEKNTYQVIFDVDGGTEIEPVSLKFEETYHLYFKEAEKEGFNFCGWYLDETLTVPINSLIMLEEEDVTVYAKWCLAPHTLTYHTADGLAYEFSFIPGNPHQPWQFNYSNFIFLGWFEEDSEIPFDFSVMPDRDVDVYERREERAFHITFVSNHSIDFDPIDFKLSDMYLDLHLEMIHEHQQLMAWYLDEALTKPFEHFTGGVFELTLYAQWSPYGLKVHKMYEEDAYMAFALDLNLEGELIIPETFRGMPIREVSGFNDSRLSRIVIPKTIRKIGTSGFGFMPNLVEVIFAEDSELEEIERFAFYRTPLQYIKLPNSLEKIGSKAFGETPMKSLWVPKSVQSIKDPFTSYFGSLYFEADELPLFYENQMNSLTFFGYEEIMKDEDMIYVRDGESLWLLGHLNQALESLHVEKSAFGYPIVGIGANAFIRSDLRTVTFDALSEVKQISKSAFSESYQLQTIAFPASLELIGERAFYMTKLSAIHIPANVVLIEKLAFTFIWQQEMTLSFAAESKLKTISDQVFLGTKNIVGTVTIPRSVETIGASAFESTNISSIIFEEGSLLKEIGARAFRSATVLSEVILPFGIEKIGTEAFYFCNKLTYVYIPSSIQVIETKAFGVSPNQIIEIDLAGPMPGFQANFYDWYTTVVYLKD